MRGLSAADIVRVWESGAGQHPIDRALTILAVADPGVGHAALCDLPIGERNRRLLLVRQHTFGPRLRALAACEQCGERVEVQAPALGDARWLDDEAAPAASGRVRALTSRDLAAAAACDNAETARACLAARAFVDDDEHAPRASELSIPLVHEIARRLHELDPLAVLLLDVQCPACRAQWECELDVAEFVWLEIEAEALRILRDVHTLASAYGWHEAEILAMSPLRRSGYLALAQ